MNRIISIVVFVLALGIFIALVHLTTYTIGFRKSNRIAVTGYLVKTTLLKNVFRGHPFSGKWYKHWVNYEYSYRVDGKQYYISGGARGQQKDIPRSITIVVQKNAPKYAIIPQYESFPTIWAIPLFAFSCVIAFSSGFYLWVH